MYEGTCTVRVQYVVLYVLSYFRTNESILYVLCSVQLYMYVTRVQYESTKVLSKVRKYFVRKYFRKYFRTRYSTVALFDTRNVYTEVELRIL